MGVPYVTSEEFLDSLITDEWYDLVLDMIKDLIKMLGDDKSDDRVWSFLVGAKKWYRQKQRILQDVLHYMND